MNDKAQAIQVSVIVAVYNSEKYLRQCLDSIANQTLREIEIICVNDGSVDRSLEILEEYAGRDSRFRIFTKENEGLGGASARNYGLERARGEYVSILDSDDFFDPEMLEKAVERAGAAAADIVVFGGYEYDERRKRRIKAHSILDESVIPPKEVFSYEDCADKIYQLSQGMAWNKLYRREFLQRYHIGFQQIKYTDDVYFTFTHMVLAQRITVLPEYLYNYRINTGSNQTAGRSRYPDSAYRPYLALKDFLVQQGVYEKVKRSFVNCTAVFMRRFYDEVEQYAAFQYLHNKYRDEIFDTLDISGHSPEYFYDYRVHLWIRAVLENSAEELAFKAARAHGADSTTSVLRFPFPYEKVPRGSRIAIIGGGFMGVYCFTQALLSGHCDVVLWVEKEAQPFSCMGHFHELSHRKYEYALITYARREAVESATAYLRDIGVPDKNIIVGEDFS